MTRASWSLKEFQQALRMKRRGASCADIASALGRSTAAIETKFRSFASVKCIMPRTSEVTTVAIEGQAEQVVVSSRDLTSVICGDPPVGHSAFDRRGGRPPTGGSEFTALRRSGARIGAYAFREYRCDIDPHGLIAESDR